MKKTFLLMFALLCTVLQGWAVSFTVSVTGGTAQGGVIYDGKTYTNGQAIEAADDYEKSDFSAVSIFGYTGKLDKNKKVVAYYKFRRITWGFPRRKLGEKKACNPTGAGRAGILFVIL